MNRVSASIAHAPTTRRGVGIVERTGAKIKSPFPLLLQHDALRKPIGRVKAVKVTDEGIEVSLEPVK